MSRSSRCQNATKAPEKRGGTGGGAKVASWPRVDIAGGESRQGGVRACSPAAAGWLCRLSSNHPAVDGDDQGLRSLTPTTISRSFSQGMGCEGGAARLRQRQRGEPQSALRGSGEGWARHFLLLFLGPGSRLAVESQRSGGMFCEASPCPNRDDLLQQMPSYEVTAVRFRVRYSHTATTHRRKALTAHSNTHREHGRRRAPALHRQP